MATEQLVPPDTHIDELVTSGVPVSHNRDSLVRTSELVWANGEVAGVQIPVTPCGTLMSPVETETNVPLPIVARSNGMHPNRHHTFFYKRHYINGSLGQQAVRYSRLQRVNTAAHSRFHEEYEGTAFPLDEAEAYSLAILNCAGYVPHFGVKIDHKDIAIAELSGPERRKLRKPGIFTAESTRESQATIGQFLMQYAISQNFDHVQQSLIEEFLAIQPDAMRTDELLRERKLHLGMKLANKAIGLAVDPVNPKFSWARRTYSLRKNAPSNAWQVVKHMVGGREPEYFGELESRLSRQYLGATA